MPDAPSGDFPFFSTVDFWRMRHRAYEKSFTNDVRTHRQSKTKNGSPEFRTAVFYSILLFFNELYNRRYVLQGVGMMLTFGLNNHL